jgi:hypothetical protein
VDLYLGPKMAHGKYEKKNVVRSIDWDSTVYDQQPLSNNRVLMNSHNLKDCCVWLGMCCSCSAPSFADKKKVTEWYIIVNQHMYQFWTHTCCYGLLYITTRSIISVHVGMATKFIILWTEHKGQLAVIWKQVKFVCNDSGF